MREVIACVRACECGRRESVGERWREGEIVLVRGSLLVRGGEGGTE